MPEKNCSTCANGDSYTCHVKACYDYSHHIFKQDYKETVYIRHCYTCRHADRSVYSLPCKRCVAQSKWEA